MLILQKSSNLSGVMEAETISKNGANLKKVFFWALFSIFASVCVAQENKAITEQLKQKYDLVVYHGGYYQVRLNGKAGICDLGGNEIFPPSKYESVTKTGSNGYYSVSLNGKAGLCDPSGKEVVPCKYNFVTYAYKGYYSILDNGKWGAYSMTGKEVVPTGKYDKIHYFEGRYYLVGLGKKGKYKSEKYGVYDLEGNNVIPCEYEYASYFDGKARVTIKRKQYDYPSTEQQIAKAKYDAKRAKAAQRDGTQLIQALTIVSAVAQGMADAQATTSPYNTQQQQPKQQPSSQQKPCHLCKSNVGKMWAHTNKGDGKCYYCNSSGQSEACVNNPYGGNICRDSYCIARNHRCKYCEGTNVCQDCKGTGYR